MNKCAVLQFLKTIFYLALLCTQSYAAMGDASQPIGSNYITETSFSFALQPVDDTQLSQTLSILTSNAFNFASITEMDLSGQLNLTDKIFTLIAEKFKNLEYLNVSLCGITNEGLSAIARKNPKLKHVNVMDCPKITNDAIVSVIALCPFVEIDTTEGTIRPEISTSRRRSCEKNPAVLLDNLDISKQTY